MAGQVSVPSASASVEAGPDWRQAVEGVLAGLDLAAPDLALLFASWDYAADFDAIVAEVRARSGARVLAGCSGQGVIGPEREVEDEPAVSLAAFHLPGAVLRAVRVGREDVQRRATRESWEELLGPLAGAGGLIVFAEPFFDCEPFLIALSGFFPGLPVVGGIASGDRRSGAAALFLDAAVLDEGAVAVVLAGEYRLETVVSQGASPIGEPWTITAATENIVETIGMRPAYQVLVETLLALPPEQRLRAQQNLLVGLATDEYKDEFRRGDFLIRNLVGADRERGLLALNAYPRVGQTLQFQMRDAAAADEDLRELLAALRRRLGGVRPLGALLCACNGRGAGLFGASDHDARTVAEVLGSLPLAGSFCNGEIGPVGRRTFLHGFTASLAVIVPRAEAGAED
jgi:small ligand-binding sensory domain FIST